MCRINSADLINCDKFSWSRSSFAVRNLRSCPLLLPRRGDDLLKTSLEPIFLSTSLSTRHVKWWSPILAYFFFFFYISVIDIVAYRGEGDYCRRRFFDRGSEERRNSAVAKWNKQTDPRSITLASRFPHANLLCIEERRARMTYLIGLKGRTPRTPPTFFSFRGRKRVIDFQERFHLSLYCSASCTCSLVCFSPLLLLLRESPLHWRIATPRRFIFF